MHKLNLKLTETHSAHITMQDNELETFVKHAYIESKYTDIIRKIHINKTMDVSDHESLKEILITDVIDVIRDFVNKKHRYLFNYMWDDGMGDYVEFLDDFGKSTAWYDTFELLNDKVPGVHVRAEAFEKIKGPYGYSELIFIDGDTIVNGDYMTKNVYMRDFIDEVLTEIADGKITDNDTILKWFEPIMLEHHYIG